MLASLDKHATHSFGVTHRPSSGSYDQHNVMPLAPNSPRFTLLPLTSHTSAGSGAQTTDHIQKKVWNTLCLQLGRLFFNCLNYYLIGLHGSICIKTYCRERVSWDLREQLFVLSSVSTLMTSPWMRQLFFLAAKALITILSIGILPSE